MLTYEEQADIIDAVYSNDFNVDDFKAYTIRGTNEENTYNEEFINKVCIHRLDYDERTKEFVDYVKMYLKFFFSMNPKIMVAYWDGKYVDPNDALPNVNYMLRVNKTEFNFLITPDKKPQCVIDAVSDCYKRHLIIVNSLEDFKNVDQFEIILIEPTGNDRLISILKNDDIDGFITFCARNPSYENIKLKYYNIVELTVWYGAIKCLKNLLSSIKAQRPHSSNLEYIIAKTNNIECFKVIELNYSYLIDFKELTKEAIIRHRNDLFDYLRYNYDVIKEPTRALMTALNANNYYVAMLLVEKYTVKLFATKLWKNMLYIELRSHINFLLKASVENNITLFGSIYDMFIVVLETPLSFDIIKLLFKYAPSERSEEMTILRYVIAKCIAREKPATYTNELIKLIHGSYTLDYNDIWNLDICRLLHDITRISHQVNMACFISTVFTENYVYTRHEYRKLWYMVRANKRNHPEITILLTFYETQLNKHKNQSITIY